MCDNWFLRLLPAMTLGTLLLPGCSDTNVTAGRVTSDIKNRIVRRIAPDGSPDQSSKVSASRRYRRSSSALLYVPNWSPSTVQIYRAKENNPSPLSTITNGIDSPEDTCIDADGNLYVANDPVAGSGWISVYAAGQTQPFETITKGIDGPAGCAIDAAGNLWVTNFDGTNVTEYLKGTQQPHAVITKGLSTPNGIAIDHAGNLYVSDGPAYTTINVQVYPPGGDSPARTITDGVTSPVGITVDAKGILYVTNINENNVEEYRVGKSHPFQKITDHLNEPAGITVSKKGRLYVSNYGNAVIVEFAPGSITASRKSITQQLYTPTGPAHFPVLLP